MCRSRYIIENRERLTKRGGAQGIANGRDNMPFAGLRVEHAHETPCRGLKIIDKSWHRVRQDHVNGVLAVGVFLFAAKEQKGKDDQGDRRIDEQVIEAETSHEGRGKAGEGAPTIPNSMGGRQ